MLYICVKLPSTISVSDEADRLKNTYPGDPYARAHKHIVIITSHRLVNFHRKYAHWKYICIC